MVEGITTRPELIPTAERLAWETIHYCLQREDDPRPSLTAAAACINILNLMFTRARSGDSHYTTDKALTMLAKLDECLANFDRLSEQWHQSGNWHRLSPQRIQECQDHAESIINMRQLALKTIERIHRESVK